MNKFTYSYFSGANTSIVINNAWIDCAGISYKLLSSKQPIYSHYSPVYDILSTARQIIQGNFVLNYTQADYLLDIINGEIYSKINKTISSNWPKPNQDKDSSDYVFNTYYLQYNNTVSFDIYIDFGKNNYTVLKDCRITTRAQSINIDDEVLLEEFSFIAREIKISQDVQIQKSYLDYLQSNTQKIIPETTTEKNAKQNIPKPNVDNNTTTKELIKPITAITQPVTNQKSDSKTVSTSQKQQVESNGITLPTEKVLKSKTTKIELDGTIAQKVQLIKQNLKAMKKILNDAEAKFDRNNKNDITGEYFRKNKYIFEEFKKMTGGIPPTSLFIPKDMEDEEELKKYYKDGAEFVETLVTKSNLVNHAAFNDINTDTLEEGILNDYFKLDDVKKTKTISHDQYLAAINTLVLSNSVMLPISIGEISTIANTILNPKAQTDESRINKIVQYDQNKVNSFIDSYKDIQDKDKFTLPFLGSLSDKSWADILPNTDSLKPSAFTNLGMYEKDFDKYKKQFNSSNLSINEFMKNKTTSTDSANWSRNINDSAQLKQVYYPYYLFNNFYDSYITSRDNLFFYKTYDGLSASDKTLLDNSPWSLTLENQQDYEKNPLEFFNRINYYDLNENSNTRYTMEEFLNKKKLFEAPDHEK